MLISLVLPFLDLVSVKDRLTIISILQSLVPSWLDMEDMEATEVMVDMVTEVMDMVDMDMEAMVTEVMDMGDMVIMDEHITDFMLVSIHIAIESKKV